MKKYIILTMMLAFFTFSCDVLDQEPQSEIVSEVIFLNEQGVSAAVLGLYNALQQDGLYGSDITYASDQYADVSRFGGFFDEWLELDNKSIPTTNATALDIWSSAYAAINQANIIIAEIPNVNDIGYTEEERNVDIATAQAIRALCYFDLLRHFGEWWDTSSIYGVPVITESGGGDLANVELKARNTVSESWSQILNDLLDAEAVLPEISERTVVSKEFAVGMLARYYLYTGDNANAIAKATELIDNAAITLVPSYNNVFSSAVTDEDIFKLVFNAQDQSQLATLTISREEVLPEDALIRMLRSDPNDSRQNLVGASGTSSFDRILKYPDGANNTDPSLIMRLGEMYLIRAEAIISSNGNLNNALADINVLRNRAGATPATFTNIDDLTDTYMDETMKEMFAEAYRFFAIVRLDKHMEILGLQDFRRVFPIPQQELRIEGTPIIQNQGYN